MVTLLIAVHVFVCFFLIVVVLLQGGKGAQLGSAFGGGSSQTLFGGRGAATFMNKLTTAVAILFMVTSLVLTLLSTRKGTIIKPDVASEERTVPAPSSGVLPETGGVIPETPEGSPAETPSENQ